MVFRIERTAFRRWRAVSIDRERKNRLQGLEDGVEKVDRIQRGVKV
jgi:hypothetical protein